MPDSELLTMPRRSAPQNVEERVAGLSTRFAHRRTHELLRTVIEDEFPGRVALVSSFGSESAILLHMVSSIDPATPVIFVDTGRLFTQTLDYRDQLVSQLGLTDIRIATADATLIQDADPDRRLYQRDNDRCCEIRKIAPLAGALDGFQAWITGRKRYQGGARQNIGLVESESTRIKINPLADWTRDDVEAYLGDYGLPRHPLFAQGYSSIGCEPCTTAPADGGERDGRWGGTGKTECGIHFDLAAYEPDRS